MPELLQVRLVVEQVGPGVAVSRDEDAVRLRTVVRHGEPPAESPPFEISGGAIAPDTQGVALGGIRTPAVDAPISVETGEVPADRSGLCILFGDSRPFDPAMLADLYPTHTDYVDAVSQAADATVAAGFLLREDAEAIVTASDDANIPN